MRAFKSIVNLLKPSELAIANESCAVCGFPVSVRLCKMDVGVRCPICGASAIAQSLVEALICKIPNLNECDAYELSSAGVMVSFLKRRARSLTVSEFFDDVPVGGFSSSGVRCEDAQSLTFADESFDLCTSTEVFEHVESDFAAFGECLRVLRPGGTLIFTVPLTDSPTTVERTTLHNGKRHLTMPAEYHADRFRGPHVFCYRNYGKDILDRLCQVGFANATFYRPARGLFGFARDVVIASRA
jgi:SAM-dependent methyltransferase